MTLFDVFNLDNKKNVPISYETFKLLGWTPNDYLIYKCYCEEIRAAAILIERIILKGNSFCLKNSISREDMAQSLIEPPLTELFSFLQRFSDTQLPQPIGIIGWVRPFTRFQHIPFLEMELSNPCPSFMYVSIQHFDVWIETYISRILHNQPLLEIPDEDEEIDLSLDEVEREIATLKMKRSYNVDTEFPEKMDNYWQLITWAEDKSKYNAMEELIEEGLERLYERKRALEDAMFDQKKTTLYIYRGGNIICSRNHHKITEVTCEITTLDGTKVHINAQFCNKCLKYTLSETSYELYKSKYKLLPLKWQYVNKNGDYTQNFEDRQQYSPLFLAGYNVKKQNGLSDQERQKLLKYLIDNDIISKTEIIKYLRCFLEMNFENRKMREARQKWRNDLDFVQAYNMETQHRSAIQDIEPYSSK